jgi:cell division protein ZapA
LKHTVQVTILGQQYAVKSEASPDEVAKVVDFVNEKIAEVTATGRVSDSLNAAVLALLNLAGMFLRLQEERSAPTALPFSDPQTDSRLLRLLERLEQACPESS